MPDAAGRWYARVGKRILDVTIAVPAVVLLAPFLLIVAALVRVTLGAPIFFRQTRPGKGGRPFELLKFRTMLQSADSAGHPLPDAQRLAPFGRVLRSTSLDELPELWNVLRGDMSLVGPRPLLMQYLPRYNPEQARRHEVRPGVTGWAQIHGRNALTWDQKFAHDVWYVDHVSLQLDLSILLKTCGAVLSRRGISSPGEATMGEFMGSSPHVAGGPVAGNPVAAGPVAGSPVAGGLQPAGKSGGRVG